MLYAICAYDNYSSNDRADDYLVMEGTERDIESISNEIFDNYTYCPLVVDTNKPLDELNDMFSHNPDGFLEKYCAIKNHI